MPAPSQKAREYFQTKWGSMDSLEGDLDLFTLELREALFKAIRLAEDGGYHRSLAPWRAVLESYTPSPEEEKG